eukprot:SAG22_NODE_567_length_9042_cov_5.458459_2_plen_31_part_00
MLYPLAASEDKASKTLWRRSSEGHHDEQTA